MTWATAIRHRGERTAIEAGGWPALTKASHAAGMTAQARTGRGSGVPLGDHKPNPVLRQLGAGQGPSTEG